uniref:CD276 antigen-like n=1 Tax=Semicossyphus pulcher TaxID=241346 RepID=UPI0037E9716F
MELLPLVSLCLLFGAKITAGDVNGPAAFKVFVEEDSDAILPCSFGSTNIKGAFFVWKKVGEVREVYLYEAGRIDRSEGRVSHFENDLQNGNASIVIKGTKLADTGNYTCTFHRDQSDIKSRVELIVGTCPEPDVKILDETKDWSLLQCVVRGASPKPKVEWQDSSGNILPAKEPQVTERGGSYDIILQTTVTKTDNYSCVVTQEEICHQIEDEIFVYIHSTCPKPYVTSHKETKDWSLLQCVVRGASPKPKVEWQDSSGNILQANEPQVTERGGSYDIILQTTVTKTDNYSCVVTQEEICHQIFSNISIYIDGAALEPSVTILDQSSDWSLLKCVVRGASPKPKVEWQDSSGNILPAKEPQVIERGGSYDIILQTTVTQTDHYRCVVTQEEIDHQTEAEIYVHFNGTCPKPDVKILDQTKDWSLLQCVVRGASPKPKVEWQDSSGNILHAKGPQVTERGGSYDITLQTTVTTTDRYNCVVICHQIEDDIFVYIHHEGSTGSVVTAAVFGILFFVVVGVVVVLVHKLCKSKKGRTAVPQTDA